MKSSKNKKSVKKNAWYHNKFIYLVFFIAVITATYFLFIKKPSDPDFKKEGDVTFFRKNDKQDIVHIDVEVANNNNDRMKGLMFRREMDEDHGMLFIFEAPDMQSFWMRNTILPLDIMFIDSVGVIDTIYRRTTPYSEKSIPSRRRVQFVVEVNGGWSDKHGIKEGDLIEFNVDK